MQDSSAKDLLCDKVQELNLIFIWIDIIWKEILTIM